MMNELIKFAEPLEHILHCYESGLTPTHFDLLNAKDELRKIKDQVENLMESYIKTREIAREDRSRWLGAERDRAKLAEENKLLKESLNNAVAYARINGHGDLYDLRLQKNPHVDQTTVLPLYSNKEEFKRLTESLKKT
jgi:hypothetical protein